MPVNQFPMIKLLRMDLRELFVLAHDLQIRLEALEYVNDTPAIDPSPDGKSLLKYPCSQCEKGYSYASDLKKHERMHHMDKNAEHRLKCEHCKKSFHYPYEMKRHMANVHPMVRYPNKTMGNATA